jgi:hypothetical protein
VGLTGYQMDAPFALSLFLEIRKWMGQGVFEIFQGAIIDALDEAKAKLKRKKSQSQSKQSQSEQPPEDRDDDPLTASGDTPQEEEPEHRGKLILDATVAPLAIRYPPDPSLLNIKPGSSVKSS